MKKELTSTTTPPIFEQIKRLDEYGVEYWSARDLSKAIEYLEYRNFQPAIERAKEACQNSGQNVSNHFVDIHEMVTTGKGGERSVESVKRNLQKGGAQVYKVLKNLIDLLKRGVNGYIYQNLFRFYLKR